MKMKVTKYPQSHLIIITDSGKKLIIDPGYFTYQSNFKVSDFQGADCYLITHQHPDHLDPETIKEVVGDKPVYGNADVVAKLYEVGVKGTEVRDREDFTIDGVKITPIDLPHFTKLGVEMPQNTGFLIDGVFFHPGDGDKAPDELESEKLALPIGGATITLDTALQFTKDIKAKMVIPIHYDYYKADPEEFKKMAEAFGIEVRPLAPGAETTI